MNIVHSMHGMMGGNGSMESTTTGMMNHNGMGGMGGMTGHGQMSGMMMHGMKMYFNVELPVHVLFFEWNIVTHGQLAGSCIGIFLFSLLYEGLKSFRQYLIRKSAPKRCYQRNDKDSEISFSGGKGVLSQMFNGWHLLQSFLQLIQTTAGLFLMLVFMTYNIWLALSVSLGSGFGYLLFSWSPILRGDVGEHCN